MAYEKAERDEIIGNIVLAEWTLFQAVQNVGGRADCQDMPNTFSAMRRAQFDSWPDEALDSYADDLAEAIQAGRNPVAEKYAYIDGLDPPGGVRGAPRLSAGGLCREARPRRADRRD